MSNPINNYIFNKLFLIVLFSIINMSLFGQSSRENLEAQAQQMANFFKNENFGPYVNFVHPEVLKMAGGSDRMIELIEQQFSALKDAEMVIQDVVMGKPTPIVSYKNQLQSTIPQSLIITTPDSRITSKYNLIAVSNDSGKSWSFIDTQGKDILTMRKTFPSLSSELILPNKELIQQ